MGKQEHKPTPNPGDEKFPGYPHYPKKEDIYEKDKKEPLKEEDDVSNIGPDLDIPGAELDDKSEAIGAEDEENNYYSLGGDQHEDLEEGEDD